MNIEELKQFALKWKSSVTDLQKKRDDLVAKREKLEARLDGLRRAYVPESDLKGFVMDYITAEGQRLLSAIRTRIHRFIHPTRMPGIVPSEQVKPLSFDEMEQVLRHGGASSAQNRDGQTVLCGQLCEFHNPEGLDQIYLLFMGEMIKSMLEKHWDSFGIGYQNVRLSEIGSDRATRRKEVAAVEAEISRVNAEIQALESSIQELKAGVV